MVQLLLKNVALTVIDTHQGGKKLYTDFGELQFMRYGVAGAVMLVPTLFYAITCFVFGKPDAGPMIGGYLGALFLIASFSIF